MGKDADRQKSPKQILRRLGDAVQPVQQIDKQQDDKTCAENPKLLTDDGKYHVIVGLRDASQLLDTVPQTFSKQAAGTDGIECLQRLIGCI